MAASGGHVEAVRILLACKADPLLQNWYGNALHCAAEAGQCASIRELVSHGMDPNCLSRAGFRPLSCTLDNEQVDAFETLLSCQADISLRPKYLSYSILHHAVVYGCQGIVDVILRRQLVDLESRTVGGQTALHLAACQHRPAILVRLLDAGAEVNTLDNSGNSPLGWAHRQRDMAAVSILLQRGADEKLAS